MKKIIAILFVVCIIVSTTVYASGVSANFPAASENGIAKVDNAVGTVWKTVTTIVQILAFAAIIFAGLRYMFASADQKADLKKSLGMLTAGAILVFATSTVVKFVIDAATEIIGQ